MAAKCKSNKECVDANPRLVVAVMAIGMIVGAIFTPSKSAEGASESSPPAACATNDK